MNTYIYIYISIAILAQVGAEPPLAEMVSAAVFVQTIAPLLASHHSIAFLEAQAPVA